MIFISAAVLTLGPLRAYAGTESMVIKTEASAIMRQGVSDVKAIALEEALKNAVLEAIISLTGGERPAAQTEAQILSEHRAFITNYRVITENWIKASIDPSKAETNSEAQEGDVYSAMIEASIDMERLREALAKTREGEASAQVTITILEVTDYQVFQALIAAIKKTPAIKDIAYNTFSRGRITLTVKSSESAASTVQRLATKVKDGFEVRSSGPRNISIKAVSKAGTSR